MAQREELVQSAVESAANIGGQVGAVGRRSYRRGTGLAEGELGSEARRPSDRGHADPGSHRAVHPGPTADGTRGRSALAAASCGGACRACRALELAAGQFGVTIGDTRLSSSWRYVTIMAILAPPKIFSSTCLIGVFDLGGVARAAGWRPTFRVLIFGLCKDDLHRQYWPPLKPQ